MKMRFLLVTVLVIMSFCAGSLFGHHATEVNFDLSNLKILKGVITSVNWLNPHSYIFMDVKTCRVDNYAVELGSQSGLYRGRMTRDTLKPGMALSILSAPAKSNNIPSRPDVEDRAKSRHFVLGGCMTLASGEKLEFGEGPNCATRVSPIPEEGILPQ